MVKQLKTILCSILLILPFIFSSCSNDDYEPSNESETRMVTAKPSVCEPRIKFYLSSTPIIYGDLRITQYYPLESPNNVATVSYDMNYRYENKPQILIQNEDSVKQYFKITNIKMNLVTTKSSMGDTRCGQMPNGQSVYNNPKLYLIDDVNYVSCDWLGEPRHGQEPCSWYVRDPGYYISVTADLIDVIDNNNIVKAASYFDVRVVNGNLSLRPNIPYSDRYKFPYSDKNR